MRRDPLVFALQVVVVAVIGFIVLPADCGDVAAGTPVTVEPMAQPVWGQPAPPND